MTERRSRSPELTNLKDAASAPDPLPPIERFKHAVQRGDATALRTVLADSDDARAVINEPIFDFAAPALVAVAGREDVALVDALLEFGADPNRRSEWWAGGFHPLHTAPAAMGYSLGLFWRCTRPLAVGLLIHLGLDALDCAAMLICR